MSKNQIEQTDGEGKSGIACKDSDCKLYICGCLAAGTPIAMDKAHEKPNQEIKIGDTLVGYDHNTKDTVSAKVVRLVSSATNKLNRLFIQGKPLDIADGHPVYVPAKQRYLPVDSLRAGMKLLALSGALLAIDSVQTVWANAPTYDFEVAGTHNYFAGEVPVLVHNNSECNTRLKAQGFPAQRIGEIQAALNNVLAAITPALSDADKALAIKKFLDDVEVSSSFKSKFLETALDVEGMVKAWEGWIDFPNLRKRIDVLENYYPKRSKIILDVEETFPGCHSIERHGAQLSPSDLQLRAKGEHPTLPPTKKSTKFDNEQIHNDAVNAAFNQHKAGIETHFANGGGYKEWDIDYGSQVGSGYYNSGEYGAGAVLNEVTTTKVKISFNKDPSNPTGYKMISAYPWYNP